MEDSILNSIKLALGLPIEYEPFDQQVIMHTNTAFMILHQLGVGPAEGFRITGPDETWSEYLADYSQLDATKTYVANKVRLLWDTPTNGTVLGALERETANLEWRLMVYVDPKNMVPAE